MEKINNNSGIYYYLANPIKKEIIELGKDFENIKDFFDVEPFEDEKFNTMSYIQINNISLFQYYLMDDVFYIENELDYEDCLVKSKIISENIVNWASGEKILLYEDSGENIFNLNNYYRDYEPDNYDENWNYTFIGTIEDF